MVWGERRVSELRWVWHEWVVRFVSTIRNWLSGKFRSWPYMSCITCCCSNFLFPCHVTHQFFVSMSCHPSIFCFHVMSLSSLAPSLPLQHAQASEPLQEPALCTEEQKVSTPVHCSWSSAPAHDNGYSISGDARWPTNTCPQCSAPMHTSQSQAMLDDPPVCSPMVQHPCSADFHSVSIESEHSLARSFQHPNLSIGPLSPAPLHTTMATPS